MMGILEIELAHGEDLAKTGPPMHKEDCCKGLLRFAESRDKISCAVYDREDFYVSGIHGNPVNDSVIMKYDLSQPEIFQLRHDPAHARHGDERRGGLDE
jgi:hypothetical protein